MEADRQAEAIRQRQAIVYRVARVERVVLLAGVARHDGAAVGGDGEADIARAGLHTALQPAAQRARARAIAILEAEIVDKHQKLPLHPRQRAKQRRQRGQRLGGDLHQRDAARGLRLCGGDGGAQHRRFAHAPRAPQQHVVRGVPGGKARDIGHHQLLLRVDPAQQTESGSLQPGHGARATGAPHIGRGGEPVRHNRGGGQKAFQQFRYARQMCALIHSQPILLPKPRPHP